MRRMSPATCRTFIAVAAAALLGCNAERKQECDRFLSAMQPLGQAPLTVETVERVHAALLTIQFQDEPLREYAKSAAATLEVLSRTLALEADPSPPDGAADLAKERLRQAVGARDDVSKYCSP